MELIWEQIARIDERQVELEQTALALTREREELEQMQNGGIEEQLSRQAHHELLVRQRALMEATEEHRRMIRRLIEEFDTESESIESDTDSGTDYTEVADSDESCPDDEKIKMICTCDCNVKEANLF